MSENHMHIEASAPIASYLSALCFCFLASEQSSLPISY